MSLSSYHEIQLQNTAKNAVHIDDGMAIVQSVASQKSWGDYFLKWLTPTRVHNPLKVHIAFDNYTGNQMSESRYRQRKMVSH